MGTQIRQESEIQCAVRNADEAVILAAIEVLRAGKEGADIRTALERGNAILTAAGRKPVCIDDVLVTVGASV